MVLIDFSQVCLSNILLQLGGKTELSEDLLRHLVLNTIRSYVQKFSGEYGQLIVCADSKSYWRRSFYPQYKATRRRDREASGLDWHYIFEVLNKVKEEIKESFPYRVIEVPGAEADDVIAVLTQEHFNQEKILIISGDKDFQQLQRYNVITDSRSSIRVVQFSPILKKFINTEDPIAYLFEHILRGDRGDGVPNFLSHDDVFVKGERQKPISKIKVEEWLRKEPEEFCNEEMLRNFRRNEKLIDLRMIPDDIRQAILAEYEKAPQGDRRKIFSYMVAHRMRQLIECIQDF